MAGDDWGITPTWTQITRNTVSTSQPTIWNDDRGSSYYYENIIYESIQESQKKLQIIKELLRKQTIEKMKDTWTFWKNQFRSIPKIRPSIQLRGVSLNGRGWA